MVKRVQKVGTSLFGPSSGIVLERIDIDFTGRMEKIRKQARERMDAFFKECLGVFDTALTCNHCPGVFIKDKVLEEEPRYVHVRDIRFGPDLHPPTMSTRFPDLYHYFFCPECGQVYDTEVMLKKRGCIPKEVFYRKDHK